MLDARAAALLSPVLAAAARRLVALGVTANGLTLAAFALGLCSAGLIALGHPLAALPFLLAGRTADGLDGAVARLRGPSDFGGYLDIVCDFVFYAAVPLAFAWRDPAANSLPAAVLLASFYVNAAGLLAFAAIAARRGMEAERGPRKALYFAAGLAEGVETIAIYVAMCLFPAAFPWLAYGFAALCGATVVGRLMLARGRF